MECQRNLLFPSKFIHIEFVCMIVFNLQETMGTQVLISAPGGLIELFVTKQVLSYHKIYSLIMCSCVLVGSIYRIDK